LTLRVIDCFGYMFDNLE